MGQRIVHVDDQPDYCGQIAYAFRALAPAVTITPFQYGQDAVRHLELCGPGAIAAPDLLLVDRCLPDLDGFEVVRAVRALPQMRNLFVLMLSQTWEPEFVHLSTAVGADGYIRKPLGDDAKLVRDILALSPWRRERVEHSLSAPVRRDISLPTTPAVISAPMPASSTLAFPTAPTPGFFQNLFAHLTVYFPALAEVDPHAADGMFVNQDELDVTYAERQARVTRRQVVDLERHRGYDMDEKRRNYFTALYARKWTLSQIMEAYPMFSEDYFKRLRPVRKSSTS